MVKGHGLAGCFAIGAIFIALMALWMLFGGFIAMLAWNFVMHGLIGSFREISWLEGIGLWFVLSLLLSLLRRGSNN